MYITFFLREFEMDSATIDKMEAMMEKMLNKFANTLEETVKSIQKSFEKRCDAMESQIFNLSQENAELKKTIEELKGRETNANAAIENANKDVLAIKREILGLKQKQFEKRAIVLSTNKEPNLNLPADASSTQPKATKEGKFLSVIDFNTVNDKISYLATKKEKPFRVYPALCPELKEIYTRALQLLTDGFVTKCYIYKDQINVVHKNGKKYIISSVLEVNIMRNL